MAELPDWSGAQNEFPNTFKPYHNLSLFASIIFYLYLFFTYCLYFPHIFMQERIQYTQTPKELSMSKVRFVFLSTAAVLLGFLHLSMITDRSFVSEQQFHRFTDALFRTEITSSTLNLHYTLQTPENYGIEHYPVTYGQDEELSLVISAAPSALDYQNLLYQISYDALDSEDQLTYDILALYLENEKNSQAFALYFEPLGATIGIQAQLPVLLAEYPFYREQDIDTYLELIAQTDQYFSSILEYEKKKSAAGLFMTKENAEAILNQCRTFLSMTDENNFLLTIFNEKIQNCSFLNKEQQTAYIAANKKNVHSHVMPAYQLLLDGMAQLSASGQNPHGLCYFPEGKAYYEYLIRASVGSYLPIAGIEKRIRRQLSEDLTACRTLLTKYDQTSLANPFSTLPDDPTQILTELTTFMKTDFPEVPEVHYNVKYVHEALADFLSPAFYLTPPIDNQADHTIYINPASNYTPLELYTTLAHEGYPGHLYQNISFSQSDCPVRSLLNFGGYTEGWATYVEMESYTYAVQSAIANQNTGTFDTATLNTVAFDTAADFAELQRLNRSVMLGLSSLLDICIHYHGFTLEDTEEFLQNLGFFGADTASSIYQAVLESPANYLKYYLGYLTFLDLRTYFQETYPKAFSLKDFHQQILSIGPCQFPVLEKYLKAYYE